MSPNGALATTLEDRLVELGGIAASRVRLDPTPGQATLEDLLAANESREGGLVELVDGSLVEKAMGYEASVVAMAIAHILRHFVSKNRLGLVSGADGFFRLLSTTRGPDVAFVSLDRLPGGSFPTQNYPQLVPNLVVEVLSPGNTKAEMARKRLEYFHSGVQIVWMVDCKHRTIAIYTSPSNVRVVGEREFIDGGNAIQGFTSPVADFFVDLDIGKQSPST
ncbi:MAG: Uma2 family endonuclease [Planctomycetota bacterium]|nr:Uma2 family endonuclease [Planctomycetota bacterium]